MTPQCAAPVFKVANLHTALKYYQDVLGFTEDFLVGNYGGVKLGNILIHLTEQSTQTKSEFDKPIGGSIVYIFCDEVDSYYAQIERKGAKVKYPPKDWPYGMREFMVADADGNHLAFGCDSKKVPT